MLKKQFNKYKDILIKTPNIWEEIGKVNLWVDNPTNVKWADIIIGSDSALLMIGVPIPNYNYEHRKHRGKGIGTKVAQFILNYLKKNGIKTVFGEISDRDNFELVSNFWKKIGFNVEKYSKKRGKMLASIRKDL